MPVSKEELQERAQLVRVHEANCQIQHPSPQEANFRMATMKKLAETYGFRELKQSLITGSEMKLPSRSQGPAQR